MKIYLINIGDELLIGQVVNTLAADIAKRLDRVNAALSRVEVVGDGEREISDAVRRGLDSDADVIITTGGLGPTRDDITKTVMARLFGGTMIEDAATLENVKRVVEARGLRLNELTRAQAMVPSVCRVIQNRVGTAPIMWFESGKKIIVSMPGVPFETLTMLDERVLPDLVRKFPSSEAFAHAVLIVTGYTESALAQELADIEDALPNYLHLAYLPRPGIVRLRLDGLHHDAGFINDQVNLWADRIAARLGQAVKARQDLNDAQILLKVLGEHNMTVGTAESCTGGNIAHQITMIPGSSASFMGSVVSYANDVKIRLLGVDRDAVDANGVVSEPVVRQMALGACRALDVDVAIATSGIAGPSGAVPGKPVGTVCIAVAVGDKVITSTHHFPGSRDRVIDRATSAAIIMAVDAVTEARYSRHGYQDSPL